MTHAFGESYRGHQYLNTSHLAGTDTYDNGANVTLDRSSGQQQVCRSSHFSHDHHHIGLHDTHNSAHELGRERSGQWVLSGARETRTISELRK